MSASKAEILEAVEQLALQAEGGLEKKPNVKDVESIVGADVTAAERDEAWSEFQAKIKAESESESESESDEDDRELASAVITNNCKNSITIKGVDIAAGASVAVDGFDPDHKVMQAWVKAEVISVK